MQLLISTITKIGNLKRKNKLSYNAPLLIGA